MRAALAIILTAGCLQPAGYFDDLRDAHADPDGDGWTAAQGDCGPHDPAVGPYMPEACDDKDNDCDGQIDEEPEDAEAWFDGDGDGFGDAAAVIVTCTPPEGFVAAGAPDCDDDSALTYPGAEERCDSSDNDCDGLVDEDPAVDAPTWYLDVDADGYGSSVDAVTSCSPPSEEWVLNGDDCEPTDPDIHPGMTEVCNGEDDDCDGLADNPPISGDTLWYPDVDRDGFGDASAEGLCEPDPGFVSNNLDCGDRDAEVKPGAVEVCNDGVDNDCSGVAEGCEWPSVVHLEDEIALSPADPSGFGFGLGLAVVDIDGDGRAELIVDDGGAPSVGGSSRGAIHVFEAPLLESSDTSRAVTWRSSDPGLTFIGLRMAAADINGDGFVDLALSSQSATAPGHGQGVVAVGLGPFSAAGEDISEVLDARLYDRGDMNDDFGRMLAPVDDISGDGVADLLVGVERYGYPASQGAVLVLAEYAAGSRSAWDTARSTLLGEDADNFGWCGTAADVNADGVRDVVVGAPYRGAQGQVLVFHGPIAGTMAASDADVAIVGRTSNAQLGKGCGALRDGNGDGYEDIGVGAPADGFGWVGVFAEGFTSATTPAAAATAQLLGTASGSGGYFGTSVLPTGDLNQDGTDDLIIGEVQWDPLAARVWFGPVSGVRADVDADITLWTPVEEGGYLRNLHGGDDLTGDTVPDILVADELRDEGRVWLVPGVGF